MNFKEKPICSYCGSDKVQIDASAIWNIDTQEYVLSQVFDVVWCSNCEESRNPDWEEIT